ncbi:hypothetical protein ACFLW2_03295 [Chloroflexota bacterium]
MKEKTIKITLVAVTLLVCSFILKGTLIREATIEKAEEVFGKLILAQPALAAEGDNAFPTDEAGISAYVQVSGTPDLDDVATIFDHVEDVSENHIIGTVPISNFGGNVSVHLYADVNGWIVAYFLRTEPASLMMQWSGTDTDNPNVTSIKTTLEDAIIECCNTIGSGYGSLGYYDFKYPDANGITIFARTNAATGSCFSYAKVPSSYTLYEASYYHYNYGGTSTLKLDNTEVSAAIGDGNKAAQLYSKTLFTTDVLHEIEVTHSQTSGSAGVANVLVYKTG